MSPGLEGMITMSDAKVDTSEIENIKDEVMQAIRKITDYAAADLEGNLQEESPVDHGRLQGSWVREIVNQLTQRIYSTAEYALVVSEGSDPYEILPVNAQALRFVIDGDVVFAKRVQHPGIEGTGYIDTAIGRTEDRVEDFVDRALSEVGL